MQTLLAEVSLEEVLNMLAYMAHIGHISEDHLHVGLKLLLSETHGWDVNDLVNQITYRKEVLDGNSRSLSKIQDVTMGLDRNTQSYEQMLSTARKIKQAMNPLAEPEIDLTVIPF